MADTIKDFLIGLGFKLDNASLRTFNEAVTNSHKLVRDFAVSITGLAVAAEESIRRTARSFENLFYVSQQTGVSVRGLQQVGFAFSQIGLSAGDARAALASVAISLRDNPGLRGLANSLVPGWKDTKDIVEGLAQQYKGLIDKFGATGPAIEAASVPLRNYARVLGIADENIRHIALNWDAYKKGLADSEKIYNRWGLNSKQFAEQATDLSRKWGLVQEEISTAFQVFIGETFPTVSTLLHEFSEWLGNKAAPIAKEWAKSFGTWIKDEKTIDRLKKLLSDIGTIATTIGEGISTLADSDTFNNLNTSIIGLGDTLKTVNGYIKQTIDFLKWLDDHTPAWLLKIEKGELPSGADIAAPREDPQSSYPLDKLKEFFGPNKPQEFTAPIPNSPEFTAPIPPAGGDQLYHPGSYQGGARYRPAAFGGGGGSDPLELLLIGFKNWWSGSSAFEPIVVISDEFYNKFADMISRLFGLEGNSAGSAGGGKGGSGGAPRTLAGSIYEAISKAEGTFGAGGINYDDWQGHADLGKASEMTLAEIMSKQHGETPAAGGFQIQRGTLSDAAKGLGLDPNTTKFTPDVQRRMADWIHQNQGLGAWSGFKSHPELINQATPGAAAGAVDKMMRLSGLGQFAPAVANFIKEGGINLDPRYAAWCAAFVNSALAQEGIKGATNVARSFLHWGQGVDPANAQKGDVLVLGRGQDSGIGGHVGLATGRYQGDLIEMIQGNRDHKVGLSWERLQDLTARRPIGSDGRDGRGINIDSEHKIEINVHGASDQHATARATRDVLERQQALYARNLRTQLA